MSKPTPNWPDETNYSAITPSPAAPSSAHNPADEINQKVQAVQEALLELKRQQDEVERQGRELENLSRKQREFEEGRRGILEKLTRGLVVLERQEFEVKREAEQIKLIRESFSEQLQQIEEIEPQEWGPKDLEAELTRALARIDQAGAVHSQARVRLEALQEAADEEEMEEEQLVQAPKSFGQMVKEGLAYSLVPILVVIVLIILVLSRSGGAPG